MLVIGLGLGIRGADLELEGWQYGASDLDLG